VALAVVVGSAAEILAAAADSVALAAAVLAAVELAEAGRGSSLSLEVVVFQV